MMDWFRSHHGAPTDPKWMAVARRADTQPGVVAAVWWALMDHASRNESDRGSVAGFDTEALACFFGWEQPTIDAVVAALREKGMIDGDRLAAWDRRQPKREDGSAERARRWREEKKAEKEGANATERNRTLDKKREDTEEKKTTSTDRPADRYTEEFAEAWTTYPRRDGDNPKAKAFKAWNGSLRRGATPAQLLTATKHYAAFVASKGKVGTEFVKQAATFYGPDEPWRDYLDEPPMRKTGSSNPWVIPYTPPTREELEADANTVTRSMAEFRRQREAERGAA